MGDPPSLPAWDRFFDYAIDAMSQKTAILPARERFFKFSHAPQLHKAQANEFLATFQHKAIILSKSFTRYSQHVQFLHK